MSVSMTKIRKCGFIDPDSFESDDISCMIVGCKGCKHFNGTVYFESNVKKALGIYSRKMLEQWEDEL